MIHQVPSTSIHAWYWYLVTVPGNIISRLCSVGYVQNQTRGYYPTTTFCKFCRTFIPVPGTSVRYVRHSYPYPELYVSSVRPWPQYPGYGYNSFIPARNFCEFCTPVPHYRNFCEFCNTSIRVPGTSGGSVRTPFPYAELL